MILCPFKAEAKLIAKYLLDVKKLGNNCYSFRYGRVICANGIGKQAIIQCILENFDNTSIPILFGTAGSLVSDINIGEVYCASKVINNTGKNIEMGTIPFLNIESYYTTDVPILNNQDRNTLFKNSGCKLVEMEGIYFANYFSNKNIECYMVRVVSDTPTYRFKIPFSEKIVLGVNDFAKKLIIFAR